MAPSMFIARGRPSSASAGIPLQAAVAVGVTALGDHHGGAVEGAARMLLEAGEVGEDADEAARSTVRAYRDVGWEDVAYDGPEPPP